MRLGGRGNSGLGWRDRLVASDPGLGRFRMAGSGVLAMGSVLGVEYLYARATGAGPKNTLIAMLLGAVIAMMGSMALSGGARDNGITAVFFPVAMGSGLVVGAAVASHHTLLLVVFVVVMFIAVYIRRFGVRFFGYGFMAWIGYFFASFLGATFGALPQLVIYVVIASGWVLLLSTTVLRSRSDRVLDRTLSAFEARARALALAAAEVLGGGDSDHGRRRLHSRQVRLTEAALMIDGQLGEAAALPGRWSGAGLRRWLVDAQLAVDGLAMAALALAAEPEADLLRAGAAQVARALARGDATGADAAARALLDAAAQHGAGGTPAQHRGCHQARHLAVAALDYTDSARHWASAGAGSRPVEDRGEFEPAVTLMMGNLPGSAAVARDVEARGRHWNPLTGLALTTRQAIQVALAGGLAILAGRELSPVRYYWAVIAAFVVFSGTATRSETVIKGANRVVGTLAGLGVAIVLADATAGHTPAVLAVILVSMFAGFYLFRISYAFMIFFITIMVAQLYSVLHEFTAGLLILRLEETAVGAGIGIAVALLFLPVSTRDTARAARASFYTALRDLLCGAADRLVDPTATVDLDALARGLDNRLSQLTVVLRPLTRPLLVGSDPVAVRHRLTLYTACATYARGLSAAVRRSQPDWEAAAAAGGAQLAHAARSLAAAAAGLAGGDRAGAVARDAQEQLEEAAAILDGWAGAANDPAVDPVEHALGRLRTGLGQLAGPAPDTDPTPPPPPLPPVAVGAHSGGG